MAQFPFPGGFPALPSPSPQGGGMSPGFRPPMPPQMPQGLPQMPQGGVPSPIPGFNLPQMGGGMPRLPHPQLPQGAGAFPGFPQMGGQLGMPQGFNPAQALQMMHGQFQGIKPPQGFSGQLPQLPPGLF